MDRQHVIDALAPLGLGNIGAIVEMAGGTSPVYRIDLASGDVVVLKLYAADYVVPGKDAFAARQLQHLDVPVTRFLLVDDTNRRLPFRYAVTNYLPGITAAALRDHPDIASIHRQTGALLRQLHTIKMPAYGAFDATGIVAPAATNAAFMTGLIEHAFAEMATEGADAALLARLRTIIDDGFDAVVPHSSGAVFAHDDLHPNNVLAVEGPDGRLTLSGLIDFGNARAADPVLDLAKCLFCSEHDAPGSTRHILAGYGPIDHPQPDAALAYYTLFHRMVMWWWLRRIGVIPTPDAPSDLMDTLRETARNS